jgi:hypothetical protein
MELSGRPDSRRPHGHETLLSYYHHLRDAHEERHGNTDDFVLDADDCMKLQLESVQFYHRRISWLEIEEFAAAMDDADHNLSIMDLIDEYASDGTYRDIFLQYRPFVMVHRTMAEARLHWERKEYDEALEALDKTSEEIREFHRERGHDEMSGESGEIAYLERLAEEMSKTRPLSLEQRLENELNEAVEGEEFERAAQLRDELTDLRKNLPNIVDPL